LLYNIGMESRIKSGVYEIKNTITGLVYIGSGENIRRRWALHRNLLGKGTHSNPHLQNSWNKHGADAFTFRVVEEVADPTQLIVREQAWIDSTRCFDRSHGYNLSPTAYSLLGFKFSEEQKARVSAGLKGKPKSEQHRANIWATREVTPEFRALMSANGSKSKGRPQSDAHRAKRAAAQVGSKNPSAKLTESDVAEIKRRLAAGEKGCRLAEEFGVRDPIISEIKTGKRWVHVRV
jgi:group I intron endonuclease